MVLEVLEQVDGSRASCRVVEIPLPFFEAAQDPDGGFGLIGISSPSTTQPSDPDSTGEVIQALVALKQLSNAAFTITEAWTPIR